MSSKPTVTRGALLLGAIAAAMWTLIAAVLLLSTSRCVPLSAATMARTAADVAADQLRAECAKLEAADAKACKDAVELARGLCK